MEEFPTLFFQLLQTYSFSIFERKSGLSKEEEFYFRVKIHILTLTTFSVNNRNCRIQHYLQVTIVDGKVWTADHELLSCFVEQLPKRRTTCWKSVWVWPTSFKSWNSLFRNVLFISLQGWMLGSGRFSWVMRRDKQVADGKLYKQNEFTCRVGFIEYRS